MLPMIGKDITSIPDLAGLRRLLWGNFAGHDMTVDEVSHIFKLCDALWLHSGDPAAPHAELTSGNCSNGFVDVLRVIRYTNLCELLAQQLVRIIEAKLYDELGCDGKVDWVVGSDHAGADFSHAVATWLLTQHDFTEKGPNKTQIWNRFMIEPGEAVLQVEELVTTTGTLQAVRDGIRRSHPHPVKFAPIVATLIHRSHVYEFEGAPIIYLAHYDIETWEPEWCPLCKAGSVRLRPKQNWARLTGRE